MLARTTDLVRELWIAGELLQTQTRDEARAQVNRIRKAWFRARDEHEKSQSRLAKLTPDTPEWEEEQALCDQLEEARIRARDNYFDADWLHKRFVGGLVHPIRPGTTLGFQ